MDERTAEAFEDVLPVQVYSKKLLDEDTLARLVMLDPYESEEDQKALAEAGVVFFRTGDNALGAVADTEFSGEAFYTQVYVKDGIVSSWFVQNESRTVVQIKRNFVTFNFNR